MDRQNTVLNTVNDVLRGIGENRGVIVISVIGLSLFKWWRVYRRRVLDRFYEVDGVEYGIVVKRGSELSGGVRRGIWEVFVRRPNEEFLKGVLSGENVGVFYLVTGQRGTGKSFLFRDLCSRIPGAAYVNASYGVNFVAILGRKFDLGGSLIDMLDSIGETSARHLKKKGVPLYLVIDHCNQIDKTSLDILQAFATIHAELGDIIIVFISEGRVPYPLRNSHTKMLQILIKELDMDLAVKYLYTCMKIDLGKARDLANLVGGNILLLNIIIQLYGNIDSFTTQDVETFLRYQNKPINPISNRIHP